jgi:dUTP pyrophosphatase
MKKGVLEPVYPTSEATEFISRTCRGIIAKVKAISPEFIPKYETSGAACCDLRANLAPNKELTIGYMETVKIDVGFSMQLPKGYEAQIRTRSGLGSKGIIIPNSPGTIDEDFRDNLCVLLTNLRQEPYTVMHLDRIAQMALKPVWYFAFEEVDTLDNTERGGGGFGSTGVK